MFSIVLDNELADKNGIKELGKFIAGKAQGTLFILQQCTNPQSKPFGGQETVLDETTVHV